MNVFVDSAVVVVTKTCINILNVQHVRPNSLQTPTTISINCIKVYNLLTIKVTKVFIFHHMVQLLPTKQLKSAFDDDNFKLLTLTLNFKLLQRFLLHHSVVSRRTSTLTKQSNLHDLLAMNNCLTLNKIIITTFH